MKTSELLRACADKLHPTEHWLHLQRIYSRAYLCHIADGAYGRLGQMESALKASGWRGRGTAFWLSNLEDHNAALELELQGGEVWLLNTARIIWCLATAKTYEELGD